MVEKYFLAIVGGVNTHQKCMIEVLRELTPEQLKCGPILGCPAIFELADGTLLIIGRRLSVDQIPVELRSKISTEEEVVIVSKKLIGWEDR